uniref:Uncharacterized protein n=1 Tax=Brassica campestris TaxID=3711 RepID=A0A3P6BZA0_BRACM|nr:unnamed protein product [Brassica rapa]
MVSLLVLLLLIVKLWRLNFSRKSPRLRSLLLAAISLFWFISGPRRE